MPIYEFFCQETNKVYSFFARSMLKPGVVPKCPDNPDFPMQRLVSSFAVIGGAKEPVDDAGESGLDDPRMEAAMAELEKEMAGMDEENPDPRRMGQLMRRMTEMTGEKMPEVMEEMVRRLESGEDPDKLEEEFGDLPELDDFGDGEEGNALPAGESVKSMLNRFHGPVRDPQLYELGDYL